MNIEDQVANIDLSKKLSEIGVKKDSFFAWFFLPHEDKFGLSTQTKSRFGIPAFTVAELGRMMPNELVITKVYYRSFITNKSGEPQVNWKYKDKHTNLAGDYTEADAMAWILIDLIENNLVKVEDL